LEKLKEKRTREETLFVNIRNLCDVSLTKEKTLFPKRNLLKIGV